VSAHDAAVAALAAHDRLRAADANEPSLHALTGLPLDPTLWREWHANDYKPAYSEWSAAMDALDAATGEHIGRHPFTFRPYCEALL
jgi:hypothetical protein